MPKPLEHLSESDRHTIQVNKDDLTNDSQYNDAVSWICGRMIGVFGLYQFMLRAIVALGYSFRGGDRRKTCWKDLAKAEEALLVAAIEYDRARQAVREDQRPGRKGKPS